MIPHAKTILTRIERLPKYRKEVSPHYSSGATCIYVLYNRKKAVYVGMTGALRYRIKEHIYKSFSHYKFIEVPFKHARQIERLVISFLRPLINSGVTPESIAVFLRATKL